MRQRDRARSDSERRQRSQLLHLNIGAEQAFKIYKNEILKARLDIVNLTDNSYELRSGSGVGVNAAQ